MVAAHHDSLFVETKLLLFPNKKIEFVLKMMDNIIYAGLSAITMIFLLLLYLLGEVPTIFVNILEK